MNYQLVKDVVNLLQEFEAQNLKKGVYQNDVEGFKKWIAQSMLWNSAGPEPEWEGKEQGRSAESVINTLIVHLNRYARAYSKAAIMGSAFTTQEDFIYLINLKAFGPMTKMELIKKNIHDKPAGMLIINRLIERGWVVQTDSDNDKRSRQINITPEGAEALAKQMDKIRQASLMVAGDLTHPEKMELIRLLQKLDDFHQPIYLRQKSPSHLLEEASRQFSLN